MADSMTLVSTVEGMPLILQQKFSEAVYCGASESDLRFAALLGTIELYLTFSPTVLERVVQSIKGVQDLKNVRQPQPAWWTIQAGQSLLHERALSLDLGEELAYTAQYPPKSIGVPGGISHTEVQLLSKFSQKMIVKITVYTAVSKSQFVPVYAGDVPCIFLWKDSSGYFVLHYQTLQTALQATTRTSEGCKVVQGCVSSQGMADYSPTLLQTQMRLKELQDSNTRLLSLLSSFAQAIGTLRKDDNFVSDANLVFMNRGKAEIIALIQRIEKLDPEFPAAEYVKQLELLKFSPGLICSTCKEKVGVEFFKCEHTFCKECWGRQSGGCTEVKKCPICRTLPHEESVATPSKASFPAVCPTCQKTRSADQFVDSLNCIFCDPASVETGVRARCDSCQKFSHVDRSRTTCLSSHFLCEECYAQSVVMNDCVKCMNISNSSALCSLCEKGPYEQLLLKRCKNDSQICLDCTRNHVKQEGERLCCELCSQYVPDEKAKVMKRFTECLSINKAIMSEISAPPPGVEIMRCTHCTEVLPCTGIDGEHCTKVMCAVCNTESIVIKP